MSLLYPGALPTTVCVDGVEYGIRSKYYIVLEIIRLLEGDDQELDKTERMILALSLFYTDAVPPDGMKGIEAMQRFIEMGSWSNGYVPAHKPKERALDFEVDAPFIWASMKQAYPFWDWSQAHWWEFKAAFDSLPVTSKIKEVMQIRTREIDSSMDKEQADSLRELKNFYRLAQVNLPQRSAKDIEAELKAKAEVS